MLRRFWPIPTYLCQPQLWEGEQSSEQATQISGHQHLSEAESHTVALSLGIPRADLEPRASRVPSNACAALLLAQGTERTLPWRVPIGSWGDG